MLASARHEYVPTTAGYALRKLYPKHSIVLTSDPRLNPLCACQKHVRLPPSAGTYLHVAFPGAYAIPLEKTPLMTDVFFVSLPKKSGGGALADSIDYAAFRVAWDVSPCVDTSSFLELTRRLFRLAEIRVSDVPRSGELSAARQTRVAHCVQTTSISVLGFLL